MVVNRNLKHLQEIDGKSRDMRCRCGDGSRQCDDVGWEIGCSGQLAGKGRLPQGQGRHCRQAAFQISPACNYPRQSPPTTSSCLDSRPPYGFRGPESYVIFSSKRSLLKKACSSGRLIAALQFQSRLRTRVTLKWIYPSWLPPAFCPYAVAEML